jgi:pimeloyl-ACP methyl ester carboxylesterase
MPVVRRLALRILNSARHGDRAPAGPLPCPISLAWSEKDSLSPVAAYGEVARERPPAATFEILPDVDHVPMFDDPELVAHTILAVTGAVTHVNDWET